MSVSRWTSPLKMSSTFLVASAQAVDELRAQDVDLAVEDPATVGDLLLLGAELLDQVLELLVAQGAEVRKGFVHGHSLRWIRVEAVSVPRDASIGRV